MGGSPLLRTILVAIALACIAVGIAGVTKPKVHATPVPSVRDEENQPESVVSPFFLTLSAKAKLVLIEVGGDKVEMRPDSLTPTGDIKISGEHPTIFLTVEWESDEEIPRFAKLVLEPPRLPTLSKTFDSSGRISAVWEPHFHK